MPHPRHLLLPLAALAAASCVSMPKPVIVADPPPFPSPRVTATATPKATATVAPTTFPATPTPTPRVNPFGLPARVSLPVPAALRTLTGVGLIGNDGSTLIGNDGSTLIGNDGSTLIGNDGSTLINAGGMNYALLGARGDAAATQLRVNLEIVLRTTGLLDLILAGVAKAGPIPDVPITFDDPRSAGGKLTAVLSLEPDHAAVFIDAGTAIDPARRLVVLRCTSPTRGRVTFRSLPSGDAVNRVAIALAYDLAAGTTSAAGVIERPPRGGNARTFTASSWDLRAADGAFGIRLASLYRSPEAGFTTSRALVAADFDADGRAAHWFRGAQPDTGQPAVFLEQETAPTAPDLKPYGFFMGPDGKDLAPADAPAALRARLPAVDAPVPALPPEPLPGDPFAHPRVQFPEAP